ncbi:hypothetical protein HDU96_000867 [Phlyctochytrium bullatum]|nr:hypothetical protein HDU96_000867 [Phlyctochytrium bullatum]
MPELITPPPVGTAGSLAVWAVSYVECTDRIAQLLDYENPLHAPLAQQQNIVEQIEKHLGAERVYLANIEQRYQQVLKGKENKFSLKSKDARQAEAEQLGREIMQFRQQVAKTEANAASAKANCERLQAAMNELAELRKSLVRMLNESFASLSPRDPGDEKLFGVLQEAIAALRQIDVDLRAHQLAQKFIAVALHRVKVAMASNAEAMVCFGHPISSSMTAALAERVVGGEAQSKAEAAAKDAMTYVACAVLCLPKALAERITKINPEDVNFPFNFSAVLAEVLNQLVYIAAWLSSSAPSIREARTSAIERVGALRKLLLQHRMGCMDAVVAAHGAAYGIDVARRRPCWKGEGNPPVNAGYTFDAILPRNGVVGDGLAIGGGLILMAD